MGLRPLDIVHPCPMVVTPLAVSSEDTTRSILYSGLGSMTDSSISALSKFESRLEYNKKISKT